MYLKSLTLKGFKSFADPTTIDLEPGVTVVVGPNGSGKSNVVDAVAWVLGAQGPSVVRSSKMDDVIFMGTAQRAALGRAEVTLVIDNASRRLPADLNEVTIRRTLFRNGDSEYALNGVECRLLDIQELLSDSGVGRQQHVIVSQGQLDTLLAARPEDRRTAIEEAAGILKFRRRRERAVRRLESAEASLVRLGDLLREVRRQIRPLERQAASAERHAALTSELHALARLLAAAEIRALRAEAVATITRLGALAEEERALAERIESLGGQIDASEARIGAEPVDALAPARSRAERLDERARGAAALLASRAHARSELARTLDEAAGVTTLVETRDRLRAEIEGTERASARLAEEWERLSSDESDLVDREATHAEHFDGVTRSASEAAAVKRAEVERRRAAFEGARRQLESASARRMALDERREGFARRAREAEERHAAGAPALATLESEIAALAEVLARAERSNAAADATLATAREQRAGAAARADALRSALAELRERTGASRLASLPGVLGPLVDLVEVDERYAVAFEAAVHTALDATVFADTASARAALAALAGDGASLLVPVDRPSSERGALPPAATWLGDHVQPRRRELGPLLAVLLERTAVVDDVDLALDLVVDGAADRVVTRGGDSFSPYGWRIGAGRAGATLDALERADEALAAAERATEHARLAAESAAEARDRAREAAHESESRRAALARDVQQAESERAELATALALLDVEAASSEEQERDAEAAVATLAAELDADAAVLADAEAAAAVEEERSTAARAARADLDDRARSLSALRRDLEVRSAALEERRGQLRARVAELTEEIERRNLAMVDADERRAALDREQAAVDGLEAELADALERLSATRSSLEREYEERRARATAELDRIAQARVRRDEAAHALERTREERQRLEIARAQLDVREEAAVAALRRELDIGPEEALAAPEVELAEGTDPARRRAEVEEELRQLGPVNLLAKEELDALSERSGFLEAQIDDAQVARRELNGVIRAVDAEISSIFAAAFADVARNFELLVSTLFPGGSGRLTLTSPDDLLETGVEIEARPAGRTVRRLSLLSGGERSLVALAFLFAIFRSRPSPFYLMDEVEAALDEINLARFLALLDEFRDEAQLIVVSHQKRTMEIADALYGVTMQPGGASKVVSERLRGRGASLPPARLS